MARAVVLLAVFSLALSGCLLRGPEITVSPPVEVKAPPAGKSFCPPGQAKKGNC